MSVRTVNVGMLCPLEILNLTPYLEGPPFYAQLRLKLTISGSRSYTDGGGITSAETLSYTKEITLDRVPMALAATAPSPAAGSSGPANVGFDYGEFTLSAPPSGEFSVAVARWEMFGISPQQIGRQMLEFFYDPSFTEEVCGTWELTGNPDPADDDSGDIMISALPSAPTFWLSTASGPEDYRKKHDRWGAQVIVPSHFSSGGAVIGQDISGWDNAQWRSKLGMNSVTYTETDWYISGSTSSVTATFEWELL